jgi:hypothetical protein
LWGEGACVRKDRRAAKGRRAVGRAERLWKREKAVGRGEGLWKGRGALGRKVETKSFKWKAELRGGDK